MNDMVHYEDDEKMLDAARKLSKCIERYDLLQRMALKRVGYTPVEVLALAKENLNVALHTLIDRAGEINGNRSK